ncbi:chaperonin 10-like protein [Aspergillus egyptiacus]|nr:chaperonin 10-like protein [Aspergillus egyptiacus]
MPSMRAIRFHGPEDIRLDQIEEPTCGKGQVKLRNSYCGICGSDLHEYTSGPVLIPKEPHNITKTTSPIIMGHEFGGVVEEVGDGVTHLSPGQKVVVRPTIFDRKCPPCKLGYEYCCDNIGFIGLSGYGGGFAEHVVAPAEHFYPIPDNVSMEAVSLIEPLAVAWHAVNLSPFREGDNVLIVGGGPVGLCILQVLKLRGAKSIMVAELMESRKTSAEEFGATHVLDPTKVDIAKTVRKLTDGIGADVVFDSAGVEKALDGAIDASRIHGTIVNVAVWEKRPHIRINEMMYHEVKYVGAALYDEKSFMDVIDAISKGQLKPEGMITDKIRLEDVVEKGFKTLLKDRATHCKILVDPRA